MRVVKNYSTGRSNQTIIAYLGVIYKYDRQLNFLFRSALSYKTFDRMMENGALHDCKPNV